MAWRYSDVAENDDERVQPALHALLIGDVDGLRTALEADLGAVNLRVGGDTMLELMTQPEAGTPSTEMVGVLIDAGARLDRALNLAGCWNLADLCTQLLAAGADMERHLLDRGASVTIEDANFNSDASGWAQACDDGSEAATSIRALLSAAPPG